MPWRGSSTRSQRSLRINIPAPPPPPHAAGIILGFIVDISQNNLVGLSLSLPREVTVAFLSSLSFSYPLRCVFKTHLLRSFLLTSPHLSVGFCMIPTQRHFPSQCFSNCLAWLQLREPNQTIENAIVHLRQHRLLNRLSCMYECILGHDTDLFLLVGHGQKSS